ncbi:MAG: SoxR reducing system RseC family protein [Bacteroidetes bacterium]|uniref:SoxR reducing system RseC family protein n=1 Tax=Candidatus Cryptobacteroides merdigallinarum TaxID=2840770 RepID=A0A9D9EIY3_9BACT|nr:SoxR reducing system RseC family protein [Candidatus Cryptobacteroides merdigallinarum]
MARNEISHRGIITAMTPELTTVEIISVSACAECHAKGVCGMSESKMKEISVPTDPYSDRKVGDEVDVVLKKSMGLKAVWISYVIPLFILMILILSLSSVTVHEVYAGLGAIGGVALYYLLIYIFRDRLAKDFVFYIK